MFRGKAYKQRGNTKILKQVFFLVNEKYNLPDNRNKKQISSRQINHKRVIRILILKQE